MWCPRVLSGLVLAPWVFPGLSMHPSLLRAVSLCGAVLLSSVFALPVGAVPPLMVAAEVAGESLEVYVRPRSLLVARQTASTGMALRPLEGEASSPLPADLDKWTALPPDGCRTKAPSFRWMRGERQAMAQVTGEWTAPVVELVVDDTVVAMGPLGRAAHVCRVHVADVDAIPGEEILLLWQTSLQEPSTRGLTVMRVPATAD